MCGIGDTHHSGGGEELHWQRGHWHYTLVIVLHKICLEAPVILREGADSPSGSEVRGICSYVPRLGSVSGAYGLKLHRGTGAHVERGTQAKAKLYTDFLELFKLTELGPYGFCNVENANRIVEWSHKKIPYNVEYHWIMQNLNKSKAGLYT